MVAARVEFMPTIQSASERERAAASSAANSSPGASCSKAAWIAALVIEFSHRRLTGLREPAFSYR